MNISCKNCNRIVNDDEVWEDHKRCKKHANEIITSTVKYQCNNCRQYIGRYNLFSDKICSMCKNDELEKESEIKLLEKRYINKEPFDINLISVLEIYPPIYVCEITFRSDKKKYVKRMSEYEFNRIRKSCELQAEDLEQEPLFIYSPELLKKKPPKYISNSSCNII
jgi:hypothetical protein